MVSRIEGCPICMAEAGNIKVLRAPWNEDFFRELENFPEGSHDDIVDALSGAFFMHAEKVGDWLSSAEMRGGNTSPADALSEREFSVFVKKLEARPGYLLQVWERVTTITHRAWMNSHPT